MEHWPFSVSGLPNLDLALPRPHVPVFDCTWALTVCRYSGRIARGGETSIRPCRMFRQPLSNSLVHECFSNDGS